MPVAIPAREGVGDCERCLRQRVEVVRHVYEVEVRDWTDDHRWVNKTVVLTERVCEACYERLTADDG